MYLAEVSMWDVVKKQFRFKLKSYRGVFSSLMVLQIIGLLFSMNGEGMSGGGTEYFGYEVKFFTGSLILAFVMVWAFISSILFTTKAYRYDDFSFVSNRAASHFSNILFMMYSSVLAAVTVYLSSYVLKLIVQLSGSGAYILSAPMTFGGFLSGMGGMILYIFLLAALGYVCGMLVQYSKIFLGVLPAVVFGAVFLEGFYSHNEPTLIPMIFSFFGRETSFFLFAVKVIVVSAIAFGTAILISNRMEVKQ
ncbi:hypothetical protein ACOJQI_02215 [Bacillus salacetis]|uniref:hypothetical protein n=1 Tax=Bacillus salacetis TaxID=2315464 RepID=UPI003BA0572C